MMVDMTPIRTVFGVLTDFLAANPSDDDLLNYGLPSDFVERAEELLDRNAQDLLTFEEQQELYDFMRADEMMALLKAKTRLRLQQENP